MNRRFRTLEEKEEDRKNILVTLKQANDWVRPGWVTKRIATSTSNLINHDLVTMVEGGTLQRTEKPFRYAIAGKFQKNQFIKDRPKKISCQTCGATKTSQWRRKNTLCNICYIRDLRSVKVQTIPERQTNNRNKSWSNEELNSLMEEVNQQLPIITIANNHGRTPKAINSRIYQLISQGKINKDNGKAIIDQKVSSSNNLLNEISKLLRLQANVKKFLNGELTLNQLKEECE
tara:strand:+ start:2206 stop:2901 length:696 start_codon:yes stop_codon:yes gene_type:complete